MLFSFLSLSLFLSYPGIASSQEAYYGYHGYSFFSSGSQVLSRGNESLSISFRSCQSDGLLLYATESSPGTGYFSIGLYQSRILIEFNFGNDLREVRMKEMINQLLFCHAVSNNINCSTSILALLFFLITLTIVLQFNLFY